VSSVSKRKKWAMGLITVGLVSLLAEIVLRFVYTPLSTTAFRPFVNPEWKHDDFYEPDRDLFWRFKKNTTLKVHPPGQKPYNIPINNQGFRGEDWPRPIQEEEARVLVLGDSCVFGWGAPVGESFPERLAGYLSEATGPVDTMHAGVPGYTSFQALRLLEKWGPVYKPGWVVVYVGWNDTAPCVEKPDKEMAQLEPGWLDDSILAESRLFALIRDFGFLVYKQLVLEKREYDRTVDWEGGAKRVSLEDFRENLLAIARRSKTLRARVVFLTRQHAVPNALLDEYNRAIREVAAEEKALLVDAASAFSKRPRSEVFLAPETDHVHPNPEGYDLLARLTATAIQEGRESDESMKN
jgi:lysophospholipase L1-like esterase